MTSDNPETSPQIQLTPVAFSPSQRGDAIGPVPPPPDPPPFQFPVFWPILIVVLALIYSTSTDILTLNRRIAIINQQDAPALEALKKSGQQAEFIEALRADLQKLSTTDPLAARYLTEYFPPAPPEKPASPTGDSKAPAK